MGWPEPGYLASIKVIRSCQSTQVAQNELLERYRNCLKKYSIGNIHLMVTVYYGVMDYNNKGKEYGEWRLKNDVKSICWRAFDKVTFIQFRTYCMKCLM